MSDFQQYGVITTLHQLGTPSRDKLEQKLNQYSRTRPLALILPALASEMDGPALPGIVEELKGADYVNEVVVSLGHADEAEFKRAKDFFKDLPQHLTILFNDGPGIQGLLHDLAQEGIRVGEDGKGRAAWLAIGLVLARGRSRCLALHDCDIIDYDRMLLARLAFPLMHPHLDYLFCKGYYARVTDRLYGRVTRLFVAPLIRALNRLVGPEPYLRFMESFRYPLSGEFAMDLDMARVNRMPADWGLEVGVLGEVFRSTSPRRVCQVDLADNYEHKHQKLSAEDPRSGLMKMCTDIGQTLLRTLASQGIDLSQGKMRALLVAYVRYAEDSISSYAADAAINGLFFDRHEEEFAVETFSSGLSRSCRQFLEDPLGHSTMSNWNRVTSISPDFMERFLKTIEADNA